MLSDPILKHAPVPIRGDDRGLENPKKGLKLPLGVNYGVHSTWVYFRQVFRLYYRDWNVNVEDLGRLRTIYTSVDTRAQADA